jgi:hypothetical protein
VEPGKHHRVECGGTQTLRHLNSVMKEGALITLLRAAASVLSQVSRAAISFWKRGSLRSE